MGRKRKTDGQTDGQREEQRDKYTKKQKEDSSIRTTNKED
jgi:hypothetical protein